MKTMQVAGGLAVGFSEPHLATDATGTPASSSLSSNSCAVDCVRARNVPLCSDKLLQAPASK